MFVGGPEAQAGTGGLDGDIRTSTSSSSVIPTTP
jgi:hypothetical protein